MGSDAPKFVWVVTWRLELEDNANQTEFVSPHVFTTKGAALAFAVLTLNHISGEWKVPADESDKDELCETLDKAAMSRGDGGMSPPYVYCLTPGDNLVVELARCELHREDRQ